MVALVFLLGLGVMYLALVAAVEFESDRPAEIENGWDNESWETQRG